MPREVAPLDPRSRLPAAPGLLGARRSILLAIALAFAWAWATLGLSLDDLVPDAGGLALAGKLLSRALTPALSSEAQFVPAGSPPLLVIALDAALHTVAFAATAMGLALVLGVLLGFCASTAWWAEEPIGARGRAGRALRRTLGPIVHAAVRTLLSVLRAIHELIWAVLFLSALGLSELAAVLAIALPTAGILGKVFSELIDEVPRGAARALQASGASGAQVFFFALVPRALPEMLSYAFYRFECALRSSAILGFFGFPTLGLQLRQSFQSTNYGEVWTYLYVLIALILVFDFWSGAVRRRIVS